MPASERGWDDEIVVWASVRLCPLRMSLKLRARGKVEVTADQLGEYLSLEATSPLVEAWAVRTAGVVGVVELNGIVLPAADPADLIRSWR
jgi:hypothetical protein